MDISTATNATSQLRTDVGESSLMDKNLDHVQLIADIGYLVSLLTLAFALLILTCIKRLRCPKNNLHLQLFISFMIRCGCHWVMRLLVHGSWIPYAVDPDVSYSQQFEIMIIIDQKLTTKPRTNSPLLPF